MNDISPLRTAVKLFVIGLGLVLLLFYVAFQARYLISGPEITLTSSVTPLQNTRQVYLSG